MGEIVKFDGLYWKGFSLPDGKQRWMCTNEKSAIRLRNREYFNKHTVGIVVYKGYETEEGKIEPVSDIVCYISIVSVVANYVGDTSGIHYKNKRYVIAGDKIYNQLPFGGAKEVKRITKELKGVLDEIRR